MDKLKYLKEKFTSEDSDQMKNFQSPSLKEKIISFIIYSYATCFSIFLTMFMLNVEQSVPFLIVVSIVTSFFRVIVAASFIEALVYGNRERTLENLSLKRYTAGLLHCILVYGIIITIDQFVLSIFFEPISMGIIFEIISLALNKLYRFLWEYKSNKR